MDFWTVLSVAMVAFFLGGLVKGIVSLGMPITALALLGSVLELRLAIPIVMVPTILLNVYQAFAGGAFGGTFRRFLWLFIGAGIGTVAGVQILFSVDGGILVGLLGILLTCYVLFSLFTLDLTVPKEWERWLSAPIGIAGGLACGAVGTMIVPIVIYLQALRLTKNLFIQTLGFLFFSQGIVWAVALAERGAFDRDTLIVSAVAMLPASAGLYIGTKFRNKLAPETFRKAIFLMLLVLGFNMLRRSGIALGLF